MLSFAPSWKTETRISNARVRNPMHPKALNQALDIYFDPRERSGASTTEAVARILEAGAVQPTLACARCEGSGRRPDGRACRRCMGMRVQQLRGPRPPKQATQACPDCASTVFARHPKPDAYQTLSTDAAEVGASPGCDRCAQRGYVPSLDVQPVHPGSYGCEAVEAQLDLCMAVTRWIRGLDPRLRAAVEALHSPRGALWRRDLATGRQAWREAHEAAPYPPELTRDLDLAPLLPLTRIGALANEHRDSGLHVGALCEARTLARRVERAKWRLQCLAGLGAAN